MIDEYIEEEVTRQKSTQFDEFRSAMDFARSIDKLVLTDNSLAVFLMSIARLVDPGSNRDLYHGSNVRRSEVGFLHGGSASRAQDVERHFFRWCNNLTYEARDYRTDLFGYFKDDEDLLDSWVKDLLQIHPWQDGNGRTASIFKNWALQTLDDPTPLPYYFGNN